MDKQKQIEEMAKLVQQDMCGDIPCEECNYHGKMKILPRYCGTYLIAEKFYNAGYRKLTESAVEMTSAEEELNDLLIEFDEMGFCPITTCPYPNAYASNWKLRLAYIIGELRKETAEKFAEKVKETKIRFDLIGNPYEKKYTQADLKEVAKGVLNQFLRWVDEICKEVISGSKTSEKQTGGEIPCGKITAFLRAIYALYAEIPYPKGGKFARNVRKGGI